MASVRTIQLEDIFEDTWHKYRLTLRKAEEVMDQDDLRIAIVVLSHVHETRPDSTIRTLQSLIENNRSDRVDICLGFQGSRLPEELQAVTERHRIKVLLSERSGLEAPIAPRGKTENILHILHALRNDALYAPERTFVLFVDNDYLLNDPINIQAMYLPWVFSNERDKVFTKAGGMRLKITEPQLEGPGSTGFLDFCSAALTRTNHSPAFLKTAMADFIPTPKNLQQRLSVSQYRELSAAVSNVTESGGRINRSLMCYLLASCTNEKALFYSQFSFLLHGDQGTSLKNWQSLHLASGYRLELSFLDNVFRRPDALVYNVIGLPHAHIPKNEGDNLEMGIDLFGYMTVLLQDARRLEVAPDKHLYYQPKTLGYEPIYVTISANASEYPSLEAIGRT